MKVLIVGHGFVGKAVDYGFNNHSCEKIIIDPLYGTSLDKIDDINVDVSFVCVPTPMGDEGEIDASIVINTVESLQHLRSGIIVIKSTVTPDIVEQLSSDPLGQRVVYNPEFLTEANANEDFVNPKMHIFGGDYDMTKKLEKLYERYSLCKPCPIHHMTAPEAAFVKYGINTFLATKVLFFNQFFDVVSKFGSNYGAIVGAIGTESRVSDSHMRVPGFDNKRGFGGACFPKDTSAFANFARNQNKHFSLLEEAITSNNEYRKDYEKDSREMEQNVNYD